MERLDGAAKASGAAIYTADLRFPGLLTAAVVRSPFPHARIVSIDPGPARTMPGVRAVLTCANLDPGALFGRRVRDIPILAAGETHFVGEPVAAVAAESAAEAEWAAAAIRVEYEPLPAVLDAEEALRPGAPAVHVAPWTFAGAVVTPHGPANLQSHAVWQHGGDVQAELATAVWLVDMTFETASVHQGYLEPQACIADATGVTIRIWMANKSPYRLREQLAAGFRIDPEQIEVEPMPVGGDFGGKGSPMDAPLCVALSRAAGRPVRLIRRYAEDLTAANPRHASRIRVRAGCDADGALRAMDVRCLFNGGAYAGFKLRPNINLHGVEEAGSPYHIPAIRIESLVAYTHTVPGGHHRAPGSPQINFAVESSLDELARAAGIDAADFRRRNLLRPGEPTALGQDRLEARGRETLDAALESCRPLPAPTGMRYGRGIAVYERAGRLGRTSMALRREPDGRVTALVPLPEVGTGTHTVVRQVVARGLGIAPERVVVQHVSTRELPHDDGVGGAKETATMSEVASLAIEAYRTSPPAPGQSVTVTYTPEGDAKVGAYAVQIAQVAVDADSGRVQVLEILSAHDVAEIINPLSHRVQIEGGVAMGFGYACLEDLRLEEGTVTAANLGEFKIPSQRDVPPVRIVLVPGGKGLGTRNVKGIAEMGNVAVAAAIANAVRDAVGVRLRALPVTAEAVYRALHGPQPDEA